MATFKYVTYTDADSHHENCSLKKALGAKTAVLMLREMYVPSTSRGSLHAVPQQCLLPVFPDADGFEHRVHR